jgi:hypothetical protein
MMCYMEWKGAESEAIIVYWRVKGRRAWKSKGPKPYKSKTRREGGMNLHTQDCRDTSIH